MTRSHLRALCIPLATAFNLSACSDFISVENPNVVDGGSIDPEADGPMIAWSAYQDFAAGLGDIVLNTAWFTTEAWTGDSSEDRAEIGRRDIDPTNPRLNSDIWVRFSRGLATSEDARDILLRSENASSNVHLARVNLSSGYSYLLMAETFCVGVARGGPALSTEQMLELAAERLEDARSIGAVSDDEDGRAIALAATVGLARARLTQNRLGEAQALAERVPGDFEYLVYTRDDPANRERLGNRLWEATVDRAALVVPPSYRAIADGGDVRVRYEDTGVNAYDGFTRMYAERKFVGWDAPYVLASGLEARYIAIEASGADDEMLAFVNSRRTMHGHDPVNFSGDDLLAEFLWQKSLDLWLEGKRIGDFHRHPDVLPGILASGEEFYKPAAGPVGDNTCLPLPFAETSTNPNL
jgi:hypothetical protein